MSTNAKPNHIVPVEQVQAMKADLSSRMDEFIAEYKRISQSSIDYFGGKAEAMEVAKTMVKSALAELCETRSEPTTVRAINAPERAGCPMRHENGNCTVAGGFCTAVNDCICEALHNAFNAGENHAYMQVAAAQKAAQAEEPKRKDGEKG